MSQRRQRGARFFPLALEVVGTKKRRSPEKDPSQVPFPTNRVPISLGEPVSVRSFVSRRMITNANANDGGSSHDAA
jgi:hypothetical protein